MNALVVMNMARVRYRSMFRQPDKLALIYKRLLETFPGVTVTRIDPFPDVIFIGVADVNRLPDLAVIESLLDADVTMNTFYGFLEIR